MNNDNNKKGFTLAELLIVIAIIAILIAIAVPVFATSMKRAQMATDDANFRAAKSAAVNAVLSGKMMVYKDASGTLVEDDLGVSKAEGGMGFYYYCTDGNFVEATVSTLPSNVEYVTAKYTTEGDEANYNPDGYHSRGGKIYLSIMTDGLGLDSDYKEGNISYNDFYTMTCDYGTVVIGFDR